MLGFNQIQLEVPQLTFVNLSLGYNLLQQSGDMIFFKDLQNLQPKKLQASNDFMKIQHFTSHPSVFSTVAG